jgi:hypothetical protein
MAISRFSFHLLNSRHLSLGVSAITETAGKLKSCDEGHRERAASSHHRCSHDSRLLLGTSYADGFGRDHSGATDDARRCDAEPKFADRTFVFGN